MFTNNQSLFVPLSKVFLGGRVFTLKSQTDKASVSIHDVFTQPLRDAIYSRLFERSDTEAFLFLEQLYKLNLRIIESAQRPASPTSLPFNSDDDRVSSKSGTGHGRSSPSSPSSPNSASRSASPASSISEAEIKDQLSELAKPDMLAGLNLGGPTKNLISKADNAGTLTIATFQPAIIELFSLLGIPSNLGRKNESPLEVGNALVPIWKAQQRDQQEQIATPEKHEVRVLGNEYIKQLDASLATLTKKISDLENQCVVYFSMVLPADVHKSKYGDPRYGDSLVFAYNPDKDNSLGFFPLSSSRLYSFDANGESKKIAVDAQRVEDIFGTTLDKLQLRGKDVDRTIDRRTRPEVWDLMTSKGAYSQHQAIIPLLKKLVVAIEKAKTDLQRELGDGYSKSFKDFLGGVNKCTDQYTDQLSNLMMDVGLSRSQDKNGVVPKDVVPLKDEAEILEILKGAQLRHPDVPESVLKQQEQLRRPEAKL